MNYYLSSEASKPLILTNRHRLSLTLPFPHFTYRETEISPGANHVHYRIMENSVWGFCQAKSLRMGSCIKSYSTLDEQADFVPDIHRGVPASAWEAVRLTLRDKTDDVGGSENQVGRKGLHPEEWVGTRTTAESLSLDSPLPDLGETSVILK